MKEIDPEQLTHTEHRLDGTKEVRITNMRDLYVLVSDRIEKEVYKVEYEVFKLKNKIQTLKSLQTGLYISMVCLMICEGLRWFT